MLTWAAARSRSTRHKDYHGIPKAAPSISAQMRLALAASLIAYSFVVASADEEEEWDDTYPDDDDDEYENGGNNKYANPSGEAPEPASSYNPEDPNANHRQEGINRDQAGDWQGAITAFQAACRHFPDDAGGCAAPAAAAAAAAQL